MHRLAQLDHRYVWHPFTQMRDWLKREPIVIVSGRGTVLRDVHGREYLDANSSIWTNLHGHNHPKLNRALQQQLRKIAHSSALGLANEPASQLAARLIQSAELGFRNAERRFNPKRTRGAATQPPHLAKVFFSDDGSTAMEAALKLAYEFARRSGRNRKPKFLSLSGAYHGDTVGAVSLGHIDLFHKAYGGLCFKTDAVMPPCCYRCPFNRAKPERADAREYRKCNWECVDQVERKFAAQKKRGEPYAAMVVEPLVQGAAGMIPQPAGWLRRVAEIVRAHGSLLIADEVMTAFGRTGLEWGTSEPFAGQAGETRPSVRRPMPARPSPSLFACHQEGVQPDLAALAKGLTGGYLPMGATLAAPEIFDAFAGEYAEFKTFFHGHSYTANQLGAAAALASLDLLESQASIGARRRLERTLREELHDLWDLSVVGDIRQIGLVAGIELVKNLRTREPFDLGEQAGIRVCEAMARRGVLTRPIGNVVVLMPPYCTTTEQAARIVDTLRKAIQETFPSAARQ